MLPVNLFRSSAETLAAQPKYGWMNTNASITLLDRWQEPPTMEGDIS